RCALESELRRARLCLHHSADERVHEMIIVFHRDTIIRPHRHRDKTESYHVILGELDIIFFDDGGRPGRLVRMGDGASGNTQVYRLAAPAWHSVLIRSEFAAIHEVTNGPFRAEDNEYAPWSPAGGEALRAFMAAAHEALVPTR